MPASASSCSIRDDHALIRHLNTIFLLPENYPLLTPKILLISLISLISLHRPPIPSPMVCIIIKSITERPRAMQNSPGHDGGQRNIFSLISLRRTYVPLALLGPQVLFPNALHFPFVPRSRFPPPSTLSPPHPNAEKPQSWTGRFRSICSVYKPGGTHR